MPKIKEATIWGVISRQGGKYEHSGSFQVHVREDHSGGVGKKTGYYGISYDEKTYDFEGPLMVVATAVSDKDDDTRNVTLFNNNETGFDLFIKSNSGNNKEAAFNFYATNVRSPES